MSRYYCLYCSSRYQFHKTKTDGVFICGICGDSLIKKPSLNLRRIIGAVAAFAFITPFLIMIIYVINEFIKDKLPNNSESLVLFNIHKSWEN